MGKAMKAMKAAMKAMKATKAMKAMKAKKAMKKKTSVIGKGKLAKAQVFRGKKAKTASGLTKASLVKSKSGKIVSKKKSDLSKRNFAKSALKKWMDAVKVARKELRISGFCPVGGKTAQGKALYAKVK